MDAPKICQKRHAPLAGARWKIRRELHRAQADGTHTASAVEYFEACGARVKEFDEYKRFGEFRL